MAERESHHDERPTPPRHSLAWLLAPVGVLLVLSWLGDAIGPGLTPDPNEPGSGNPELLLVLSPRLRWQVAAVNYVDIWVFFVLATVRLLAADPPFYLLGRWHGEAALDWAERKSPATGAMLRDSERFYGKLVYPLVAIAPNNLFCLLAGASRMRPGTFFALNIGGTLVRLWLVVRFGEAFADEIDSVLGWVGRNRWLLVGISTVAVIALSAFQSRSGTGDLGQLRELSHELDEEAQHTPDRAGASGGVDGARGVDDAASPGPEDPAPQGTDQEGQR